MYLFIHDGKCFAKVMGTVILCSWYGAIITVLIGEEMLTSGRETVAEDPVAEATFELSSGSKAHANDRSRFGK